MDFRHLRTFVTVADLGTVSKASAQLGVAQPALSRQIKDLETELGVTLFDRVRRRLILTSDGQVLLSECRNALGTLGSIRDRAQLLRRADSGDSQGRGDAANDRRRALPSWPATRNHVRTFKSG